MQSSMKMGEAIYKAQQANPDAGSGNEKNTDRQSKVTLYIVYTNL